MLDYRSVCGWWMTWMIPPQQTKEQMTYKPEILRNNTWMPEEQEKKHRSEMAKSSHMHYDMI